MPDETPQPTDSPRTTSSTASPEDVGAPTTRRGFFARLVAAALSFVLGAVPLLVGLVTFFDPLRSRRGQAGGSGNTDPEGFVRVTTLDALPEDGRPQFFQVIADRTDAWTVARHVPVGSVFLRKSESGEVVAFNATCPHAGCLVQFVDPQQGFACPCHESRFALDGVRQAGSASLRDLDRLETDIRSGQEVWVKYENFLAGLAEKVPVA